MSTIEIDEVCALLKCSRPTLMEELRTGGLPGLEVRAVNSFGAFGRVFVTCRDGGAPVIHASREEWERGF